MPQSLALPGCSIQLCPAGAALGAQESLNLLCAGPDVQGSSGFLKAMHKVQGIISIELFIASLRSSNTALIFLHLGRGQAVGGCVVVLLILPILVKAAQEKHSGCSEEAPVHVQ